MKQNNFKKDDRVVFFDDTGIRFKGTVTCSDGAFLEIRLDGSNVLRYKHYTNVTKLQRKDMSDKRRVETILKEAIKEIGVTTTCERTRRQVLRVVDELKEFHITL